MSGLLDALSGTKVVITAPDGRQLWIDPFAPSTGPAPSLPKDFSLSFEAGDIPTGDPNVTDSIAWFGLREGAGIVWNSAPLGLPFPLWLTALLLLGFYRPWKHF
jgi:hypothetical protein